jgi:histidinol phosphatase-like PHP family hydrolase
MLFADPYAAGDFVTRSAEMVALPEQVAAANPGMPLIAVQHNPLHPAIDDPYPYLPLNAEAIRAGYERAGVVLSLSGHYHAGQPLHDVGGVRYSTIPAAGDAPFRFAHVRLDGRNVELREHALRLDVPGLIDAHCHTEYSYCGKAVTAEDDIAISQLLGVSRLCLVDHSFQLYLNSDEAWSWRWQTDRALVDRAWADGRGRMPTYRRRAASLRSDFVRVGLEVDLLDDGMLFLAEEDRTGWDVLIGSVHAIHGSPRFGSSQGEVERIFLREVERLLRHPIDVLAHPFRFFRRADLAHPVHLHKPVADLLAAAGVAAEINFHINVPNVRFVEECLARGVKIALGTDSHDVVEVGDLSPHLAVLRQAGVGEADLPRVLFQPR